jgi:hypothetical protein
MCPIIRPDDEGTEVDTMRWAGARALVTHLTHFRKRRGGSYAAVPVASATRYAPSFIP